MSYEVTATRKRPSSFNSLAGQEFVVATLKNGVQSGRIAHAYLFTGPRGVGKTSAARILAKSLNCLKQSGPTADPCGECVNCLEISRGSSLDVIEIDGASNTSVNDVRQIKDEVLFAPGGSRYKVYIIDEVHMLTTNAFNALLKTIEEPPPYIVFIFATTEIQKVPATIRSRCQQFNFRRITLDVITGLLGKLCAEMKLDADKDAILWIAKEATGSLRDAYTLFDQVVSFSGGKITIQKIRDKLGFAGLDRMNELCVLLTQGKTQESFLFLDDLFSSGVSPEQFVTDMAEYFRNILWLKNGIRREAILGYGADGFSPAVIEAFQPYQVEKALAMLLELYRNLRYSLNQRFEIELVLARLAGLKNYITPQQIAARVIALRKELKTGFTVAPAGSAALPADTAAAGQPRAAEPPETVSGEKEAALAGAENDAKAAAEESSAFAETEDIAEDLSGENTAAIIHSIRKKKIALASYLEKALRWCLEDGVLRIFFDTKFAADFIRGDLAALEEQAGMVLGQKLKVEICVAQEEKTEEAAPQETEIHDERVDLAVKVFRGEVVK